MTIKLSTLKPRHASTWSYLGWSGLFLAVGLYQLGGGSISQDFAELLVADFFINLVSPFILGGGAVFAIYFGRKPLKVRWYEPVVLAAVFGILIVMPAALLLDAGGWALSLSALLFLSKAAWYGVAKGKEKTLALLFARGLVGPFLFFAPALLISAAVVGRSTLGIGSTDWVAVFGIVYFLIQAVFEEFMLRKSGLAEAREPEGIISA